MVTASRPPVLVSAANALLASAFAAMRARRALLVGDYVLDVYVYGQTVRVSREAPVLVVRKESEDSRLGGAANTAANLAALGLHTRVVGAVGHDAFGERVRALLRQAGADVEHLQTSVATTTPTKTRILAGAFGTSRQQVLRLDEEPNGLPPATLDVHLAELVERLSGDADVVLVSDYGLGSVGPAVRAMANKLAGAGHLVCVDSRCQLGAFRGVTVVTPNVPEAEAVSGVRIHDQASCERAGEWILRELACAACLLTQGRHGMTLFRRGERPVHVDIVGAEEVTDVTGAGDTVMAAFAGALAAGVGMPNAMRIANCAAGLVVTRAGTATATSEEVAQVMRTAGVELQPWPVA